MLEGLLIGLTTALSIQNLLMVIAGCLIGTFIGILPAEGATVAAIMGYNEAKRWSKRKDEFGTGIPEGIAGPEAANNAATGGAMVPTLALGIPGSASTALILAALVMHGRKPGPHLLNETPEFLYAIFGAMLIANLAFLVIGFFGARVFAQITLIPRTFLWPGVFVFSLIGAYASASSFFDVWVMLAATIALTQAGQQGREGGLQVGDQRFRGAAVDVDTRKAIALLAYLAVESGQAHSELQRLSLSLGLIATIAFLFFGEEVFSLFTKEHEMLNTGVLYLKILAVSQVFMCIEITSAGGFYGLGKSKPPSITSILVTGLRIPAALLVVNYTAFAFAGVWWCISISSVVKGVIVATLYFLTLNKLSFAGNESAQDNGLKI